MEVAKRVGYAPLGDNVCIDRLVPDNDRRWTQETDLYEQIMFGQCRGKEHHVAGCVSLPGSRHRCEMQDISGYGDE
jgi:hypothetical protein